jgi:hypothetical protein
LQIDPHKSRHTKNIHKIDRQKDSQEAKSNRLAPVHDPNEKAYEQQAKPAHPNVRNEHSPIVVSRLREIVQIAFWTPVKHIKGLFKRPTTCFKHIALMTARAFQVANAVRFRFFFLKLT